MTLKKSFVIKTIGGKCIAIATGEASLIFKGTIILNSTAEFIFRKLMNENTTVETIASEIVENFDTNYEQALLDVKAFTSKLSSVNLIIE